MTPDPPTPHLICRQTRDRVLAAVVNPLLGGLENGVFHTHLLTDPEAPGGRWLCHSPFTRRLKKTSLVTRRHGFHHRLCVPVIPVDFEPRMPLPLA